jgi:hypothetical protein
MSDQPKKQLPRWLRSSVDPAKLSLTIKGLIIFVPAFTALAAQFGLDLKPDTTTEAINQLAVAASAVATLYGLFRKLVTDRSQLDQ